MRQDKTSEEDLISYEVLVYNNGSFLSLWEKDGFINKCVYNFSNYMGKNEYTP